MTFLGAFKKTDSASALKIFGVRVKKTIILKPSVFVSLY